MFIVGRAYTKKELYKLLKVPANRQRGDWDNGYKYYEGNIYIFANIGIPGRTGHNYDNYWDGDLFYWEAKNKSLLTHPSIQRMINPPTGLDVFLFTREQNRHPYTYEGQMQVVEYQDTSPVKIIWEFKQYPYQQGGEEVSLVKEQFEMYEGSIKKVITNKYERNPHARRLCIQHHGTHCNVCDFDFYVTYGPLGEGYIHVHHIIPISALGENYVIDPEKDLIPICPNCHSMVHKKNPPLPPQELKDIISEQQKS